jgi:hypothetical protein
LPSQHGIKRGGEQQRDGDLVTIGESKGVFERRGTLPENPAGPHQRGPDRVCAARLTGFLGPDEVLTNTRDSLLHPALVDVQSVEPVSTLAARLRRRGSCGPEFGHLGDGRGEAAWGRGRAGRP